MAECFCEDCDQVRDEAVVSICDDVFCSDCSPAHVLPLSEQEVLKRRYPELFIKLDMDVPEIAERDHVEFRMVGMNDFDVVVNHWPIRGWTVSARWNRKARRWERCKRWPTPEQIEELRVRETVWKAGTKGALCSPSV